MLADGLLVVVSAVKSWLPACPSSSAVVSFNFSTFEDGGISVKTQLVASELD